MAFKKFLFLAVLIILLQLGSSSPIKKLLSDESNYTEFEEFEDSNELADNRIDYFQHYLDRKHVLLKSDEVSKKKALCFRVTFLGKGYDELELLDAELTGELNEEQIKVEESDYEKKLMSKIPKKIKNYFNCSSDSSPNVLFNYKLPAQWDKGADLNIVDVSVLVKRARFLINYPQSCKNYIGFITSPEANETSRTIENIEETENDDYMITLKECYSLAIIEKF